MPVVKTIEQLRQELEAKVMELSKLLAYRDKLQAELDAVGRRISLLHGEKPAAVAKRGRPGRKPKAAKAAEPAAPKAAKAKKGRRGRRAKGDKNLLEYIKQVLADKSDGMRIKDIASAVKDAGYKSAAKDFYTIVATTMREPGVFTKTGRGVYKLS